MSLEDDIAFLQTVPTFDLLGPGALRILAIGCESRALDQGEVLFRAGEPADCGYVVQDGLLRLETGAPDAAPEASGAGEPMSAVGPGGLLGEIALIIETTRPVTATAAEPSTVIRVSRHLFRKTLEGFPDAADRLREHFAARARQIAEEISLVGEGLDDRAETERE